MQTIRFNPAGGPLSVVMSSGQANPGNYALKLIETDGIGIVLSVPNTAFSSEPQNTHAIPTPASVNNGRFLRAVTSVGLLDPTKAFAVFMKVMQGGNVAGEVGDSGTGTGETKVSELVAELASAGLVAAVPAAKKRVTKRKAAKKRRARAKAPASRRKKPARKVKKSAAKKRALKKTTRKPKRGTKRGRRK